MTPPDPHERLIHDMAADTADCNDSPTLPLRAARRARDWRRLRRAGTIGGLATLLTVLALVMPPAPVSEPAGNPVFTAREPVLEMIDDQELFELLNDRSFVITPRTDGKRRIIFLDEEIAGESTPSSDQLL